MVTTKAQKRASIEYHKRSIKRIPLDVQISEYEEIKEAATAADKPVNTYIKEAIRDRLASDK